MKNYEYMLRGFVYHSHRVTAKSESEKKKTGFSVFTKPEVVF